MEEELYYTPDLSDIRIGYICQCTDGAQIGGDGELTEQWYVNTIGPTSSLEFIGEMIKEGRLRSRYIVIPDLINAGWLCEGKIEPPPSDPVKDTVLYKFTKDGYGLIYDFIAKVVMIYIAVGDIFSVCVQRFDCPSMNELLYIESHLNLHKP